VDQIIDWKLEFLGSEAFVGQKSDFYWIKIDFFIGLDLVYNCLMEWIFGLNLGS